MHSYYSNFLKNILKPFQEDEDITIFMPDHSFSEFNFLYDFLSTSSKSIIDFSEFEALLRTLQVSLPQPQPTGDQVNVYSEGVDTSLMEQTLETPRPIPEYLTTIPEVPTDIQTAELFDPEYLEDIEIENEEDLSLTIHTTEPEFCVVTPSRRKSKNPKKCSVIIKRKTGKTNGAEKQSNSKKINANKENLEREKEGKNYKCPVCNQKFDSEIELVVHKKVHLLPQRQRVCGFCGKYFRKMFQLQNHIRKHTGDKPFVCHTCGKAFSQETSLKTHMRIHSGLKPFKCSECEECFNVSSALTAHVMWRHNGGNRPFLCSFCSKSFPTKSAVRKHETIHKSEKKHACSHCEKKFARADHLKSHLKSHKD